jgi:hypothetical protein
MTKDEFNNKATQTKQEYFVHLVYQDSSSDWDGTRFGKQEVYEPVSGPMTPQEVLDKAYYYSPTYNNRYWYEAQLVSRTTTVTKDGETLTGDYKPAGPRLRFVERNGVVGPNELLVDQDHFKFFKPPTTSAAKTPKAPRGPRP